MSDEFRILNKYVFICKMFKWEHFLTKFDVNLTISRVPLISEITFIKNNS